MTKYFISDDTDDNVALGKWTDLLQDSESDNENEQSQTHCLISHDILDNNSITLPCNHSFNFLPLYYELLGHNRRVPNLHCPYCRIVHIDTVLPHVKLNKSMVYRQGINQPSEFCLPFHTCNYTFSSGKQKGTKCTATAYVSSDGTYCAAHHKTIKFQKEKELAKMKKKEIKQKQKTEMLIIKEEEKKKKTLQKQLLKEEKQNQLKELKLLKQKQKNEQKLLKLKLKEEQKQLKKAKKELAKKEEVNYVEEKDEITYT